PSIDGDLLMRVLLAEDHTVVRAGIHRLLSDFPMVTEIMEAADGSEAVAAVARYRPDIVLMDITMPRMNGLEATSRIVRQSPNTRVIILSIHRNEDFVRRALYAGASGYLIKAGAVVELDEALRSVHGGRTYISPSVKPLIADDWSEAGGVLGRLTPRQHEILQLIAEGMSSRKIAEMLRIQIKTVESHRTELMKRLGIHDVAGLVRFAVRHGIVDVE
ncbi:MAG: response regulator, partial [Thermoanaerobaculia bacterium]